MINNRRLKYYLLKDYHHHFVEMSCTLFEPKNKTIIRLKLTVGLN